MKKLGKFSSLIALTLMLFTGGTANAKQSFTEAGHEFEYATLKYIRLGESLEEACDTFKLLVYNFDPKKKIEITANTCGYTDFMFFGIEAINDQVVLIRLPVEYFGYTKYDNEELKKIAQDYLHSPDSMVTNLTYTKLENVLGERTISTWYGYNKAGTARIDITKHYITMYKVNKGKF